ncbi:hypothetical protein [Novosphingobium kaempferiae]|uniref:hypothetical protein n=1 Tax=Novosphingobium kaempferiae TaxID=2896849 RepID=UPI001E611982|nr:hypothetical protein [Novosphingobium kaempferiae]
MKRLFTGLLLLLPACQALPQDARGTLARIEHTRKFTVGMIAGSERGPETDQLIQRIEHASNARAERSLGEADVLLSALADGQIDLVVGAFAKDSPWKTEVSFGPSLKVAGEGGHAIEMKAAMRNGENRWIMLVERASRDSTGRARIR